MTSQIDWRVPTASISLKDCAQKVFSASMLDTLQKMSRSVREGVCEQAMYPRVTCLLLESIELYRSLIPKGFEVLIHPSLTFPGTDKCTDYAVIIVAIIQLMGVSTTLSVSTLGHTY